MEKVRVPVHFGSSQMSAVVSCETCFRFFWYNDRATLRGVSVFRRTFIYVYMYVHIYTYIYIYTVALHCFKPSKLLGYGFVLCEEFKIVYKHLFICDSTDSPEL